MFEANSLKRVILSGLHARDDSRKPVGVILVCLFAVMTPSLGLPETATVDVIIEGVPDHISKKLQSVLSISRQEAQQAMDERRLRILHRRASKEIVTALQSFGFYRAKVDGSLESRDGRWTARYHVIAGSPVRYQEINVSIVGEGKDEPTLRSGFERFPIKSGYIVDHTVYESAKRELLTTALELGYLNAQWTQRELVVDLDSYQARLNLALDTGPLFQFGDVKVIQDAFDPAFLDQFIRIKSGQRYSASRLVAVENALRDTDYFSNVTVAADLESTPGNQVPITITLQARKPSKYTFGAGFGTDTGPRGSAAWERRRVNRSGHKMSAELKASQIGQNVQARYSIPIRNPRSDTLSFATTYRNDDPDTSDSELGRFTINRSTLQGQTRWEYSLSYQRESFTVADQSDTFDLLMPGVRVSRVTTDNRLYPRHGLRVEIAMITAYDGILSDSTFAQAQLRGKWIRSLGAKNRLILRGDVGFTLASDVTRLPASIRFFTGGDQSVRGFDFEELGPVDENGEVIGGRHLLVGSVELEHRLTDVWSVAAFWDAGNAFDDFNEPLEQGVGIGLRWRTPVGPLRVDLANAISKAGNPWRLHVSFGPDF